MAKAHSGSGCISFLFVGSFEDFFHLKWSMGSIFVALGPLNGKETSGLVNVCTAREEWNGKEGIVKFINQQTQRFGQ
jgi:hypothetical protein